MRRFLSAALSILSTSLVLAHAEDNGRAQASERTWRIGFISPGAPQIGGAPNTFRTKLSELGFVEGKNLTLDVKYALGRFDQVPELAKELIANKPDAIAVVGAVTVRGVKPVIGEIPLLFTIVVDPVAEGVVSDPERPGGSITGVTNLDPLQSEKRIALLREVFPSMATLAVLGDAGVSDAQLKLAEAAAAKVGVKVLGFRIDGKSPRLDEVFSEIASQKAQAVMVLEEPVLAVHRRTIATLARQQRLPTLFPPSMADSGGLLFYGVNLAKPVARMAEMTARVLRGEKAGAIPVETIVAYDFFVNKDTAADIGVEISPAIVSRADKIISN